MESWIQDRLSSCLDFEVPDDMIKFIMTINTSEEFDDYFESLLNPKYEQHRIFMADCKKRLLSKALPNKKSSNQTQPQSKNNKKQQKNATKIDNETVAPATTGSKKKTKFVNLFTKDGLVPNAVMLKGRHVCECQAAEHKLINNCLGCGRIVCQQEGSGPCVFCGELVCTNEEMELIKSSSKKGENLKKTLEEKGGGESLQKAIEHRNQLLEYDLYGCKRTEVIDDEHDYFEEHSVWTSEEDRKKFDLLQQEMHEMKHASRFGRKLKMDLFGREIEEDPVPEEYVQKVRQEIANTLAKSADLWSNRTQDDSSTANITDPRFNGYKPAYTPTDSDVNSSDHGLEDIATTFSRVLDKDLMEMQDMGRCLSMHQPYASLLVGGIKKHEGRTWYSNHRGRLWIASTVKEPTREEIAAVEDFYKRLYNDDSMKFPSQYQSGCIVGCVNIDDVLPQEEYRKKYPDGESDSPFVFICSRPLVLPVVFPIKGQHQIYQIDPKVHRAASLALLRGKSSA